MIVWNGRLPPATTFAERGSMREAAAAVLQRDVRSRARRRPSRSPCSSIWMKLTIMPFSSAAVQVDGAARARHAEVEVHGALSGSISFARALR